MPRTPEHRVIGSIRFSILLCALVALVAIPALAQKVRPARSVDLEQLRSKFEAAVGKDFKVVKGELKGRSVLNGGGTYWLAHIKPKQAGHFKLTYRYNYNDPHYSHVEREFGLNVGPKGCRRGVPSYGSYFRFCLGDTILFPVAIYNFTEHDFTLSSTEYKAEHDAVWETGRSELAEEKLERALVNNPLADHMQYVGSRSHKLLHRNGGYTLEAYAVFEAKSPGRFNISVSADYPDVPSAVLSSTGGSGGTPLIVVERGTPVTLLASSHAVRGYTMGYDGREFVSSTSGDSFMSDVTIMLPGDRIALKYFTTIRRARDERDERAGKITSIVIPPPQITKLPFALDAKSNFTEWLIDYLPGQ